MKNKNKKPLSFLLILLVVSLIVGGTLAYYTSSDSFTNNFQTGTYSIEVQETFESPDNWTPGTTTPKVVVATNKGNTPAAIRIKLTPSWEDSEGNLLSLTDNNDVPAALINFTQNYQDRWIYNPNDGYYYYYRAIDENQSTIPLMESVTFNPDVNIDTNDSCSFDETTNTTTCTSETTGYGGGKFKLLVDVETCQYDQYQNAWGVNMIVNIPSDVDGILRVQDSDTNYTFGKEIARTSFESIKTVDNINIPDEAIDSWDVSLTGNGSVMAWYKDDDSNDKYELYIGQQDGVIANPNSGSAFAHFENVKDIDLEYYNTYIVTDMSNMFYDAGVSATTFKIDNWDRFKTGKVTTMINMFMGTGYSATTFDLGDLSGFDTGNVTDFSGMFNYAGYSATNFRIDGITGWDTSSVTTMGGMFSRAGYYSTTWTIGDISNWQTRNVTNMSYMFEGAGGGTSIATFNVGNLGKWNVSNVENMFYAFVGCGRYATDWYIGDLSNWNVSKVKYFSSAFGYAGQNDPSWSIGDISNWNISNAEALDGMFVYAASSTQTFDLGNLDNWNLSKCKKTDGMFYGTALNATTWHVGDLSNWDTSKVENMAYMFAGAGFNATTPWSIGDLSNWDVSKVTSMYAMFNGAGSKSPTFNLGNLDNWDVSNVENMSWMFNETGHASTTWNIGDISGWDVSKVKDMSFMLDTAGYEATSFSVGNIGLWGNKTSNVENMEHMFHNAGHNATTWYIGDLSNWNTAKVTNTNTMFKGAGSNSSTPINLGTLNVYGNTIYAMFYDASKMNATLNIYSNPTSYDSTFLNASTSSGAGIVVNYKDTTTNIDNIIATKSASSNVTKGNIIE